MTFLRHVMEIDGLEILILTRQFEEHRKTKHRKWMVEQNLEKITKIQNSLKAAKDRKSC